MPNMSSHMSIAKRVSEILDIDDKAFIIGNLLPDLEDDKRKSHYKIQGKLYLIPDIDRVEKELDLNDKTNLGILTHLLLDKYYLEDYLIRYPEVDVFLEKDIYKDYDIYNDRIVKYFDLDIDYLRSVLSEIKEKKYQEKLLKNINCLSIKEKGNTKYLKEDFIDFLEDTSIRIANEIRKYCEKEKKI